MRRGEAVARQRSLVICTLGLDLNAYSWLEERKAASSDSPSTTAGFLEYRRDPPGSPRRWALLPNSWLPNGADHPVVPPKAWRERPLATRFR